MSDIEHDLELDLTGLPCPLPMLEVSRRVGDLPVGGLMLAVTDNEGSLADLPAWARATGHEIVRSEQRDDEFRFLIRRTK